MLIMQKINLDFIKFIDTTKFILFIILNLIFKSFNIIILNSKLFLKYM